jgi:acyl phosphate:glycerol-3-phosphate acyltransferase
MFAIILAAVAYLLGSVNTAIIVCQALKLPDPRTEGSKNPGATNVLRIAGRNPALLVLAADVLKGFLPVLIAAIFGIKGMGLGLVALAATLGHIFPALYGFQGGKGVATALGGILGMSFPIGVVCGVTWGVTVFLTRYASLSSLIAVGIAPLLLLLINPGFFIPALAIALVVGWRHAENIERLRAGTENKMEFGNPPKA